MRCLGFCVYRREAGVCCADNVSFRGFVLSVRRGIVCGDMQTDDITDRQWAGIGQWEICNRLKNSKHGGSGRDKATGRSQEDKKPHLMASVMLAGKRQGLLQGTVNLQNLVK